MVQALCCCNFFLGRAVASFLPRLPLPYAAPSPVNGPSRITGPPCTHTAAAVCFAAHPRRPAIRNKYRTGAVSDCAFKQRNRGVGRTWWER
jgi:hypothetical protein